MSDWSWVYYLKAERVEDAFALLDRWGRPGYVYPPTKGWTTILADLDYELHQKPHVANAGILLRLDWCWATHWSFSVWNCSNFVGGYSRAWLSKKILHEPENLPLALVKLLPQLSHHRGELSALLKVDGRMCDLTMKETVARFSELLGLNFVESLNHALLDKNPADAPDADRWMAYDPRIGVAISATAPRVNRLTGIDLTAPKILYGGRKAVLREWRKVVRKVWKGASWEEALAPLEQVQFGELGDVICLGGSHGGKIGEEKMWRLDLVGEGIFSVGLDYQFKPDWPYEVLNTRILQLCMLDDAPFWFDAGLMCKLSSLCRGLEDDRKRKQADYLFLGRFVRHLHSFIRIWDSIRPDWDYSNSPDDLWVRLLIYLAGQAGWSAPSHEELVNESIGRKLSIFLNQGAVKESGGWYTLNPMPNAG